MDRGGGTSEIIKAIHSKYGHSSQPVIPTVLTEYESDWDTLYPISAFLETYKFGLDVDEIDRRFQWPQMEVRVDEADWSEGVRHLKMRFSHVSLGSGV